MSDWLGLPPDWSSQGHHGDTLLVIIHAVMLVLFVGWSAYLVVALVRFRGGAASGAIGRVPRGRMALVVAGLLGVFELALLFVFDVPLWARRLHPPDPAGSTVVRVIAEQFAWNLHYPGADGAFGRSRPELIDGVNPIGLDRDDPAAADDLVTINELHVPIGRPVVLYLRSKDVIHSFSAPYLRVKQDVVPGVEAMIWFEPRVVGATEIGCAQLCGLGHYRMRGRLVIEAAKEFAAWYEEEQSYM